MFDIVMRAASFIAIIVMGYLLKRIGVFKQEDFGVLSKIAIRITLPCAIIVSFSGKQIATLVLLVLVGVGSAVGYLTYRYQDTSRSADYTDAQRVEANKGMAQLVLDKTDDWDAETVVCIVDSAFRPMFESETDYTLSVYVLDQEAFAAGQAADSKYDMNTLWGYSKSGPKKDPYGSLIKVATAEVQKNEKTGEILSFTIVPVE